MNEDAYQTLLDRVATVGLHPDRWPHALDALAAFSGSRGVAIIPLPAGSRGLRHTAGLDALAERYVASGWSVRDFRTRAIPRMMAGHVAVDADIISYDEMRRHPYYDGFLGPLGFRHFAGFTVGEADETWAVTLQRGIGDEAFSPGEQRSLARVIKPLTDAVTIGRMLGEAYHRGTLDQVGRAGTGCILLDRLGRAGLLNRAAEAMVGRVLDIRRGAIILERDAWTTALHATIRALLDAPAAAKPLLLASARATHVIDVVRLPDLDADAFARFHAMVLVRDLRRPLLVDPDTLQALFDLTPREAGLAGMLTRSPSLVEAAAAIGIKHETARTQLKSIFEKTGAGSQNELIALLSRLERGTC